MVSKQSTLLGKKSCTSGKKLGVFQQKVLNLLCLNNSQRYVTQQTGKSKQQVSNTLKSLILSGHIKKIKRGFFRPCVLLAGATAKFQDYLRLHNLEIELRINSDIHDQIRNKVLKKQTFSNIRSSGNNGGHYFDFNNVTYMITKSKLFVFFPKDWEIVGKDIKELSIKLYDAIEKEINKFETRFHYFFFSDDRVNFNIRNIHIASVNNGVTEEFQKNNINHLCITDEQDGKPRFIMDMSKGLSELEAVHPDHAFLDADRVKSMLNTLKSGEFDTMRENNKHFFDLPNPTSASEILSLVKESVKLTNHHIVSTNTQFKETIDAVSASLLKQSSDNENLTNMFKVAVQSQQVTQNQVSAITTILSTLIKAITPSEPKELDNCTDQTYFG